MLETYLFPPDLGLTVAALTADAAALHIALATTAPTAACPLCQQPATRIQSYYSIQEKDSESRRRLLTVGMVIEGRAEQAAHAGLIRI
jgi:hypothetical protein